MNRVFEVVNSDSNHVGPTARFLRNRCLNQWPAKISFPVACLHLEKRGGISTRWYKIETRNLTRDDMWVERLDCLFACGFRRSPTQDLEIVATICTPNAARFSLSGKEMILKHKDDLAPHLAELERLLTLAMRADQRKAIEEEIFMTRAGAKGEKEAAYHIDFGWKDGKNSIVIHDLRLEHNGRVAQIDHLILFRTLECHVLESKGYGTQIRVTEAGEWEVRTRYGWKGIASPLEQNRRHIEVLKNFVDDHDLSPRRLGMSMPLSFHNWVLVSPECQIKRNARELEKVVKMDLFQSKFKERLDKAGVSWVVSSVAKFVSLETIEAIGMSLIAAHRPATFNVAARFGISACAPEAKPAPVSPVVPQEHQCKNCGVGLEAKVVNFCRLNSKRFGGQLLCLTCQKESGRTGCEECGVDLDAKVVAFCRFNAKRLGGKELCRNCQARVSCGNSSTTIQR